jgi:hypothetical protein
MSTPLAADMEKVYPIGDWIRDLDSWFSRRPLSTADFLKLQAYFVSVQAGNPALEENCRRMWMALAFLQSFLPELVRAGAARHSVSGETALPLALATALYRAFLSPAASLNPGGITVPLLLQVVKEQRDWNEDRT